VAHLPTGEEATHAAGTTPLSSSSSSSSSSRAVDMATVKTAAAVSAS
jgi:hypothetical protein